MCRLTPLALSVALAKREVAGRAHPSNQAMEQLLPFVRQTARRIHGRYSALSRQSATDFVSAAPALVWSRIDHFADWFHTQLPENERLDESKDFFAAWCYRELNFRYLDAGRAQKAQRRHLVLDEHDSPAAAETEEPFSLGPVDAAQLAEWDALDGVILFVLSGAWAIVPEEARRRWLAKLKVNDELKAEAIARAPRGRRRTMLAHALSVSRDVIYQRWLRMKKKHLL